MKMALVHDWLTGMRGGEKCLEILCELYPQADLYTLIHLKDRLSTVIEGREIRTSFLQHLPGIARYYRYCLPLFPSAIEQIDLKAYDLVVSTSHCVAKGALPRPDALHISYCLTPMRYVWDMRGEYLQNGHGGIERLIVPFFSHYLRMWDVASSHRVDEFVAISRHVQKRVRRFYGRDSTVIYPPVDCDFFCPAPTPARGGDYFLMVTAPAPYKRLDLAIEAFNRLGRRLVVVGDGPDLKGYKRMAKRNVEFVGWQGDERVRDYYRGCRAFVFPGEEDFGIAPVEAQACGRPVIAFGRGGILETVNPLPNPEATGVFFDQASADSLVEAIHVFEKNIERFDPHGIRHHATRFHKNRFRDQIHSLIDDRYRMFVSSRTEGASLA